MLNIKCRICGKTMTLDEDRRGTFVDCPSCDQLNEVPEAVWQGDQEDVSSVDNSVSTSLSSASSNANHNKNHRAKPVASSQAPNQSGENASLEQVRFRLFVLLCLVTFLGLQGFSAIKYIQSANAFRNARNEEKIHERLNREADAQYRKDLIDFKEWSEMSEMARTHMNNGFKMDDYSIDYKKTAWTSLYLSFPVLLGLILAYALVKWICCGCVRNPDPRKRFTNDQPLMRLLKVSVVAWYLGGCCAVSYLYWVDASRMSNTNRIYMSAGGTIFGLLLVGAFVYQFVKPKKKLEKKILGRKRRF